MKYQLDDKPRIFPLLMYGLQWWIVSIPCVIIMGIIVVRLHFPDGGEQIFYMQKLFALMGLTMTVQVLWGHRLPLVIGPASVLLIGILATISVGINAVYTAIMVGGLLLAILAYSGFLSRLQYIFTPRIIIVILCLIAFTLSPVILRLTFGDGENSLFHLLFVLLLVFVMFLGNKLLRGIWKSVVVLCGIIVGSLFYYGILGFPIVSQATGIADGAFSLIQWPWEFDISAILSFVFCFIALIVNELGSIQAVGKMIGADQLGKRTRRGVGLTGIANVLSGTMGIVGPVDYSMSPGIIAATGCASRYTLVPAGIGLFVCAFFPGFIQVLGAIPGAVMGAVLLYLMASQLSAGLQMLTREKCVVGFESGLIIAFPLMVALLLSFAPEATLQGIPVLIRPIIGNGFVMGVIMVLLLEHGVFRVKDHTKQRGD